MDPFDDEINPDGEQLTASQQLLLQTLHFPGESQDSFTSFSPDRDATVTGPSPAKTAVTDVPSPSPVSDANLLREAPSAHLPEASPVKERNFNKSAFSTIDVVRNAEKVSVFLSTGERDDARGGENLGFSMGGCSKKSGDKEIKYHEAGEELGFYNSIVKKFGVLKLKFLMKDKGFEVSNSYKTKRRRSWTPRVRDSPLRSADLAFPESSSKNCCRLKGKTTPKGVSSGMLESNIRRNTISVSQELARKVPVDDHIPLSENNVKQPSVLDVKSPVEKNSTKFSKSNEDVSHKFEGTNPVSFEQNRTPNLVGNKDADYLAFSKDQAMKFKILKRELAALLTGPRNPPRISKAGNEGYQDPSRNEVGAGPGIYETKAKKPRLKAKTPPEEHIKLLKLRGVPIGELVGKDVESGLNSMLLPSIFNLKTPVVNAPGSVRSPPQSLPTKISSDTSSTKRVEEGTGLCVCRSNDLALKPNGGLNLPKQVCSGRDTQLDVLHGDSCSKDTRAPMEEIDKFRYSKYINSSKFPLLKNYKQAFGVDATTSEGDVQRLRKLPSWDQVSMIDEVGTRTRLKSGSAENLVACDSHAKNGMPENIISCDSHAKNGMLENIISCDSHTKSSPGNVAGSGTGAKSNLKKVAHSESDPKNSQLNRVHFDIGPNAKRLSFTFVDAVSMLTKKSDHSIGDEDILDVSRRAGYRFPHSRPQTVSAKTQGN